MRRSSVVLLMLVTASGCTIWNRPDPSRLDAGPDDGGVDAFMEVLDASDAGPDAGDANVCTPSTEECTNRRDEDCDGLIDCADPQCIATSAAACCDATHTETLNEDFVSGTLANWQRDGAEPLVMSQGIVSFGSGDVIGMVRERSSSVPACLAVELGTRVSVTMQAISCSGASCAGFAQLVLGPSSRYVAGDRLTADLVVRGETRDGSLFVQVLENTRLVAESASLGAGPQTVSVELGLGVSAGVPAIVAQVQVSGSGQPLIENAHVVDRHLLTDVCDGLFLGIEGVGDDVRLDDVNVTQRDCPNPSRMDPVSGDTAPLDALTFSAGGWAGGGIGDPAIFAGHPDDTDTWFALFDGSRDDRAGDTFHALPLAIGGGQSTRTVGTELALSRACSDWTPRSGTYFPSCVGTEAMPLTDAVPTNRAMRNPTLYASTRTSSAFETLRVVWSGERSATDPSLALYSGSIDLTAASTARLPVGAELVIGGESCPRMRSPLLLPLSGSDNDWLLLYVCDVYPAEVRGAVGNFLGGFERDSDIRLGRAELGDLAYNGVRDIAGVVFDYDGGDEPTYRLWLVANSARDGSLVLFVEGTAAAAGEVPRLVPYAGNPVLTARDSSLPPCMTANCELRGIGATRLPSSPTEVRLLVERWEETASGTGTIYSLLPLGQTWRSDL